MTKWKGALALLAIAFTVARPGRAFAWAPDAWITAKVKIALLTTEGLSSSTVDVDTVDGQVTLHGKTASAADKAKADAVARSIDGVRGVRDFLEVVAPSRQASVDATDAGIGREVADALEQDAKLDGGRVSVASVNNGVVLLSGEVRNSAEHLRAIEVARRVHGVRRVASEVRTAPEDAELDFWNHHELRQGGRDLLDVAGDIWLTAQTRLRLLADERTPALDVSIDCRDQVITLFGTVPTVAERRAAEEVARAVSGVRDVRNELQVVAAERREVVQAKDAELETQVKDAIYARPEMKGAAIRIAVRNRMVRLSGTVPSQQHRLFAATAARRVPGVRAVREDLQVVTITEDTGPTHRSAHP